MNQPYRVAMCGVGGVGKTALTIRLIQDFFDYDYFYGGREDTFDREFDVPPLGPVTISVTDSAGQEEYEALRDYYMRENEGFVLVYSLTDMNSLADLEEFYQQILLVKRREHVPMVVVGNKVDLEEERVIAEEDGRIVASNWQVPFFETSARSDVNVSDAYFALIHSIHRDREIRREGYEDGPDDWDLDLEEPRHERPTFHQYVVNFGRGVQDCCSIV